ncbi:glycosyltransferase family 4 protein [Mangrovibacterium diazotrophicum]|uniref:Glycosyltransferase involved in cell wall biosynthesis n=1 Tax=Mangrovibacterium diazotrophicum TaxID=1261403 RepID=A0A419W3C1_9BACT|nr:glycosyltransferase family 4 protein [Mangrovibacterium diazotrophicum]RKD89972.1 glycosyltransferase involved in cell wall biosynthesis [Mangrovibacterium diazotrophicum]
MKIAHIIPGSGGSFYCGNCLRDAKYMKALQDLGQQVIKIPMYLPLFEDAHDLTEVPVFYGAVDTYLKQRFPIFRYMPPMVDKMLNSKAVLNLAAKNAGSTRAKGLEEMTISMLKGEDGLQHDELERLVEWLKEETKPDIVHLSNALLLGLARRIKQKLKIPVVCSLQDEDVWVDVMSDRNRDECWEIMKRRAKDVDAFIAVSQFYADEMKQRLHLSDKQLFVNHIGVDANDYVAKPIGDKKPVIGFISRMCEDNGLDILVDAFLLLKEDPSFADVELRITGGKTNDDNKFIQEQKTLIEQAGLSDAVHWVDEFEGNARHQFFDTISVLSVPVLNGEAFGLYQLEALASGIPLVQPELGAFPEVVNLSEGGIIYHPNSPKKLAKAWKSLILDKGWLEDLSTKGLAGVKKHFDIHEQAKKLVAIYEKIN